MGRGRIVAAIAASMALILLGWAAASNYRQLSEATEDQRIERYQPARDASSPAAAVEGMRPRPRAYDPRCGQPKDAADSDLCAQWSAVEAMNETNRLTRLALRIGYLSFFLAVAGGVFGLIGTIFLIRAFKEAKRSADAAQDANRPWIDVDVALGGPLSLGSLQASLPVRLFLTNKGNSPATGIKILALLFPLHLMKSATFDADAETARSLRHLDNAGTQFGIVVFPDSKAHSWAGEARCTARSLNEAADRWGDVSIYLGIGIRYTAGGRPASTIRTFALTRASGEDPNSISIYPAFVAVDDLALVDSGRNQLT